MTTPSEIFDILEVALTDSIAYGVKPEQLKTDIVYLCQKHAVPPMATEQVLSGFFNGAAWHGVGQRLREKHLKE